MEIKERDLMDKQEKFRKNYLEIAEERGIDNQELLSLVEKAINQIKIIEPSLKILKDRIEELQPDKIILLSKGADLFLKPLLGYLKKNNIDLIVECYNDDDLKRSYLKQESNSELIQSDFPESAEQRLLFVDETFSAGKGALAIHNISRTIKSNNVYYFSLSRDSRKGTIEDNLEAAEAKITPEEFRSDLKKMLDDSNFIISEQVIEGTLFSKDIASKTKFDEIDQATGRTVVRLIGDKNRQSKKTTFPGVTEYMSREELDDYREYKKQIPLTEKLLEEIIYDSLVG